MPRYGRLEDILKLGLKMQGSAEGLSLAYIQAEFGVSRSTAERMRNALRNVYPQIEEIDETDHQKRWRFPPGALGRLVEVTGCDLAAGYRAAALAEREGDEEASGRLRLLLDRLRAQSSTARRNRIEPDLEAQLMADGVAFRPGPRETIAPEILRALRDAILAGCMISADHRARGSGRLSRNTRLGPIAMLFGEGRQYLLAWSEYQDDLRLFALAGFEAIRQETAPYVRPEDFDLKDWLAESFGIWREEPAEVEWRFLPEVADEAATYQFHPKQRTERLPDGSLVVRFRAGGRQEMAWYLARWGDGVEVR